MAHLELFSERPRELIYREYTDGELRADRVRVRVMNAAPKHGTEFTMFRADDAFVDHDFGRDGYQMFLPLDEDKKKPFAMHPGNIWVGRVEEIGSEVEGYRIGDLVTGYGGLRPTQTPPVGNCRLVPEGMTWKQAVCYDPLHFALGGVRDGHVRLGDRVAVIGLGAIGQMTAQLARLAGAAQVIVVDPVKLRRDVAMENGADLALDPTACDAGYEIRKATEKRGADVILETSGKYEGLQQAIRGLAYAGNVAVIGWYKSCSGGLNFGMEAHFNQPNLIFSRACSEPNRDEPRWNFDRLCATCWELLSKGLIRCENIVQPVVPFEEARDTYLRIERDPSDSVKMGVSFP